MGFFHGVISNGTHINNNWIGVNNIDYYSYTHIFLYVGEEEMKCTTCIWLIDNRICPFKGCVKEDGWMVDKVDGVNQNRQADKVLPIETLERAETGSS